MEVKNGVVRFEHVNFRYPGAEEDVLHDIDFVAESGKTTAIIGSTGCRKSTLVNLIPRLYDVTGGSITLDGKDIRRITMKDLRDEIGFVPQKGVLFSGTIASNLRFGKDDASDEEIAKAAEIAQATEFIEAKDDKYETPIAQGGSNVSGGQKQRIGIARALAVEPEFVICDEPISALDVSIQAQVLNMLKELQEEMGLTYLFIAHDLSVVKYISDRVIVMYLGTMVEFADSEELYAHPLHPYTQVLLSSIPVADPKLVREKKRIMVKGEIPSPINPKDCCRFAERCPYATEECRAKLPKLREVTPGHFVACHMVK